MCARTSICLVAAGVGPPWATPSAWPSCRAADCNGYHQAANFFMQVRKRANQHELILGVDVFIEACVSDQQVAGNPRKSSENRNTTDHSSPTESQTQHLADRR